MRSLFDVCSLCSRFGSKLFVARPGPLFVLAMAIVQDIRFTWAEMMQNEPARFHVLEHWLKVTHEYAGIYFLLRDSKTTAVAQCHVTLLNGWEQRRHVAASEKTGKKYASRSSFVVPSDKGATPE